MLASLAPLAHHSQTNLDLPPAFPPHPLPPLPPNSSTVKVALRGHHTEIMEVSPETTYEDIRLHVQGKTGKAVRLGRIADQNANVEGGVVWINYV